LERARNTEEERMVRRDSWAYRLSLIFADVEAELVGSVLGDAPAESVLALCREAAARGDFA
jgi:hypothetical protein